jgi:hypothetical protein
MKNVTFAFMDRFKPLILSGQKCATIRKTKRADVGDIGMGYTGWRTPQCKKFCTFEIVRVDFTDVIIVVENWINLGFSSSDEAFRFYCQHGSPVKDGYIHFWQNVKPIEPQNGVLL